MRDDQQPNPWYREPFVWLLIGIPLAAIIGSIITARLAVDSSDGLVVDDYYKRGLEINQVLERDQTAAALGIEADIQLVSKQHSFRILLTGNGEFVPPEAITVSFLHATRGGFDRQLAVKRKEMNLYQAALPELVKGRWHIQVETANWRIIRTIIID